MRAAPRRIETKDGVRMSQKNNTSKVYIIMIYIFVTDSKQYLLILQTSYTSLLKTIISLLLTTPFVEKKLASLVVDSLVVFYCASEIWPDKRGGLWWEGIWKRGSTVLLSQAFGYFYAPPLGIASIRVFPCLY